MNKSTQQTFEDIYDPSHVGEFQLSLPQVLKDKVTDRLKNIHIAVQGQWGQEALDAAVTELKQDYGLATVQSDALQLFVHLIWLQDLGLLPGYPRYSRTIKSKSTPIPIRKYCSSHPDFEGKVTTDLINERYQIERNRVYRSKIYSVTKEFWVEASFVRGISPWMWKTYSSSQFGSNQHPIESLGPTQEEYFDTMNIYDPIYKEIEYSTTAIFDDSGAHNIVVNETRSWLSAHPRVESVIVPYVVEAPSGINDIEGIAPVDSQKPPYWMFDIGVTCGNDIVLLGNIVENEPADEIIDQIRRSYHMGHPALVVMPSRDEIHNLVKIGIDNGWLNNSTPSNDVVDSLERQPSITHLNKEIWGSVEDLRSTVFVTRKQILDEIADVQEILPSMIFDQ